MCRLLKACRRVHQPALFILGGLLLMWNLAAGACSSEGRVPCDRLQAPNLLSMDSGNDGLIRFTENRGQIVDIDGHLRPDIRYIASVQGVTLYLRTSGMSHVFTRVERPRPRVSEATGQMTEPHHLSQSQSNRMWHERIDVEFVGANPFVRVRGECRMPGWSHYHLAHCPDGITHVPSYARVVYENIYRGIDCIVSSKNGFPKYDFLVHPGADPALIRLRYKGHEYASLTDDGNIVLTASIGTVIEHAPSSLQNGRSIPTAYKLTRDQMMFGLSDYDRSAPLLIDPWSTYLGGGGHENGVDVEFDNAGNVLIVGSSGSMTFPTMNAHQSAHGGGYDATVTKLSSSGSLLWSTYLGGSAGDETGAIDLGASGNIAISGQTWSQDFPTKNAFQSALGGVADLFVASFSSSGSLRWSTYFGGSDRESEYGVSAIAVDDSDNVVCAGVTFSSDFPTLNAFQSTKAGGGDNVLGKFASNGALRWSTYYGGSDMDGRIDIGTYGTGSIVGVSQTKSVDRTLLFPLQASHSGMMDLYIFELSHDGVLQWATYYGGSGGDGLPKICVDNSGWFAVSGKTNSTDFPVKNAHQSSYGGSFWDAFVISFQNRSSIPPTVLWSTYFGSTGSEGALAVSRDVYGNVVVTGYAMDNTFPVYKAAQYGYGGGLTDAILVKFSPYGQLQSSTLWGGGSDDEGHGIAVCPPGTIHSGEIAIVGQTFSSNFPLHNPYQNGNAGLYDMFLTVFNSGGVIPVELLSFHAIIRNSDIVLHWETEHEINNAGFRIEKRLRRDAADWQSCGFVNGRNAAGTAKYQFTDPINQVVGDAVVLYRLRQIDFDGSEALSPVLEVHLGSRPSSVELYAPYPDPVDEYVSIPFFTDGSRQLIVRIINTIGQEMLSLCDGASFASGSHVLQVSTGNLEAGAYLIELTAEDTRQIRKFVISR